MALIILALYSFPLQIEELPMTAPDSPKPNDLRSMICLFADYEVPTEMRAMKQIALSSVQMFAASNLASTQVLSQHFADFRALQDTVSKLSASLVDEQANTQKQQTQILSLKRQMQSLCETNQNPLNPPSPRRLR